MAFEMIVIALNRQGERVGAQVYRQSPDGSGRLDLLIPTVDTQTRQVSYYGADKCRHGIEYVLPGEDSSVLGAGEREAITHTADTQPLPMTAKPAEQVAEDEGVFAPADTNKDGEISAKERKRYKKDHPEDNS